jgi:hypothetical protein
MGEIYCVEAIQEIYINTHMRGLRNTFQVAQLFQVEI